MVERSTPRCKPSFEAGAAAPSPRISAATTDLPARSTRARRKYFSPRRPRGALYPDLICPTVERLDEATPLNLVDP